MSLQTDAEDCLRAAIAERNGVDVPPEKMGDLKPSDGEIGAQTGLAWKATLDLAAEGLRARGHPTRPPALDKATSLLNKVLLASQSYLEQLSRPKSQLARLMFFGGTIVAIGALATALLRGSRNRK